MTDENHVGASKVLISHEVMKSWIRHADNLNDNNVTIFTTYKKQTILNNSPVNFMVSVNFQ